jgi:hypothetical protein
LQGRPKQLIGRRLSTENSDVKEPPSQLPHSEALSTFDYGRRSWPVRRATSHSRVAILRTSGLNSSRRFVST